MSDDALAHGIHYIDREVKTVAYYLSVTGSKTPIRIYGNPFTPDFLSSNYAFTYIPHSDASAASSWITAPSAEHDVDVWVCHCPPKGILDEIPSAPLTGCEVMRRKVVEAKPRMCVFGHYHYAYGRKLLSFDKEGNEVEAGKVVIGQDGLIEPTNGGGRSILFLNAAWMTMQKGQVEKRNKPWSVRAELRKD